MNNDTDTRTRILRIKSQTLNLIDTLTQTPKPSYKIDGLTVSWNEYMKQLQETICWCDSLLESMEIPWVQSRGISL